MQSLEQKDCSDYQEKKTSTFKDFFAKSKRGGSGSGRRIFRGGLSCRVVRIGTFFDISKDIQKSREDKELEAAIIDQTSSGCVGGEQIVDAKNQKLTTQ